MPAIWVICTIFSAADERRAESENELVAERRLDVATAEYRQEIVV